jgi:hypothetical protein
MFLKCELFQNSDGRGIAASRTMDLALSFFGFRGRTTPCRAQASSLGDACSANRAATTSSRWGADSDLEKPRLKRLTVVPEDEQELVAAWAAIGLPEMYAPPTAGEIADFNDPRHHTRARAEKKRRLKANRKRLREYRDALISCEPADTSDAAAYMQDTSSSTCCSTSTTTYNCNLARTSITACDELNVGRCHRCGTRHAPVSIRDALDFVRLNCGAKLEPISSIDCRELEGGRFSRPHGGPALRHHVSKELLDAFQRINGDLHEPDIDSPSPLLMAPRVSGQRLLVWAKLKGWRAWPAVVASADMQLPTGSIRVDWLSTQSHSHLPQAALAPFVDDPQDPRLLNPSNDFRLAVEEAQRLYAGRSNAGLPPQQQQQPSEADARKPVLIRC